jgi:hypothetical protein
MRIIFHSYKRKIHLSPKITFIFGSCLSWTHQFLHKDIYFYFSSGTTHCSSSKNVKWYIKRTNWFYLYHGVRHRRRNRARTEFSRSQRFKRSSTNKNFDYPPTENHSTAYGVHVYDTKLSFNSDTHLWASSKRKKHTHPPRRTMYLTRFMADRKLMKHTHSPRRTMYLTRFMADRKLMKHTHPPRRTTKLIRFKADRRSWGCQFNINIW